MEQNLTYEEAYKELALIAKDIENESVSVDVLAQKEQSMDFGILSEEALLNMYIWAANNPDIPEEGNGLDEQNSPELLKLLLLFNDDVLDRFAKAKRIANKNNDRPILKTIFSQRFPQNDIIEIDYGKLIFSQTYKLMELLNFMEATPKYQHLYSHLLLIGYSRFQQDCQQNITLT